MPAYKEDFKVTRTWKEKYELLIADLRRTYSKTSSNICVICKHEPTVKCKCDLEKCQFEPKEKP